jgi:hypothetical protein
VTESRNDSWEKHHNKNRTRLTQFIHIPNLIINSDMIHFPVNVLEKSSDTNQISLETVALDVSHRWRLRSVNDVGDKHCNTVKTCNFRLNFIIFLLPIMCPHYA